MIFLLALLISTIGSGVRFGEVSRTAPSAGFINVQGTKLRYVVEGSGPPCLVIGSSLYYPRTFIKSLRSHCRFYFVDMRWFAKVYAPVPLRSYTLETLVEDVEQVRKALKLDRVTLIGHSIHGAIAFEYAKRHPQHVSHLVLIGAPNVLGSAEYEKAAADLWSTASPERQKLQNYNWSHPPNYRKHPNLQADVENYLAMTPKYWYNDHYSARWLWSGMTINTDIFHYLYNTLFSNYRMFGTHPSVPVPTVVALGKYDYVIPHTLWEPYRSVPNLTLCLFEKSGHTPQLEEPGLFMKRYLQWIGKQDAHQ